MDETQQPERRRRRGRTSRLQNVRIRAGAIVAVALLVGFGVWLIVRRDGGSTTLPPRAAAVPITADALRTLSSTAGIPIYWAGPKTGFTYELTKTDDNRVWVRYLPAGVSAGANTPYLTIGTYPIQNGFAVTRTVSQRPGSVKVPIGNGGVAFYAKNSPTTVYFSYPAANYQVEVYDPTGGGQALVSGGKIVPVAGATPTPAAAAHRVTPAQLKALAASRKQPVYWAGANSGVTYELTETTGGSIYLRYLPSGVKAGVNKPYLTIGTYPLENAFTVTRDQAKKAGSVNVDIGGGAVAFYNKARPTNIYIAYAGVAQQIEVYDPSPSRAKALVATGRITSIS